MITHRNQYILLHQSETQLFFDNQRSSCRTPPPPRRTVVPNAGNEAATTSSAGTATRTPYHPRGKRGRAAAAAAAAATAAARPIERPGACGIASRAPATASSYRSTDRSPPASSSRARARTATPSKAMEGRRMMSPSMRTTSSGPTTRRHHRTASSVPGAACPGPRGGGIGATAESRRSPTGAPGGGDR